GGDLVCTGTEERRDRSDAGKRRAKPEQSEIVAYPFGDRRHVHGRSAGASDGNCSGGKILGGSAARAMVRISSTDVRGATPRRRQGEEGIEALIASRVLAKIRDRLIRDDPLRRRDDDVLRDGLVFKDDDAHIATVDGGERQRVE